MSPRRGGEEMQGVLTGNLVEVFLVFHVAPPRGALTQAALTDGLVEDTCSSRVPPMTTRPHHDSADALVVDTAGFLVAPPWGAWRRRFLAGILVEVTSATTSLRRGARRGRHASRTSGWRNSRLRRCSPRRQIRSGTAVEDACSSNSPPRNRACSKTAATAESWRTVQQHQQQQQQSPGAETQAVPHRQGGGGRSQLQHHPTRRGPRGDADKTRTAGLLWHRVASVHAVTAQRCRRPNSGEPAAPA